MGQEAAEQRRPLACAVGQDLRHKAPVVVVDDRLRHGPEERKRVDVAIDPCLRYRRWISADIAAVTVRQIQHEEVGLPLHAADDDHRSEEHTSELQSLMRNSYAVFCLKKKNN